MTGKLGIDEQFCSSGFDLSLEFIFTVSSLTILIGLWYVSSLGNKELVFYSSSTSIVYAIAVMGGV